MTQPNQKKRKKMRYELSTIEAGVEKTVAVTYDRREARRLYESLKQQNRGRLRINGGRLLRIYEADAILLNGKEYGE